MASAGPRLDLPSAPPRRFLASQGNAEPGWGWHGACPWGIRLLRERRLLTQGARVQEPGCRLQDPGPAASEAYSRPRYYKVADAHGG